MHEICKSAVANMMIVWTFEVIYDKLTWKESILKQKDIMMIIQYFILIMMKSKKKKKNTSNADVLIWPYDHPHTHTGPVHWSISYIAFYSWIMEVCAIGKQNLWVLPGTILSVSF